MLTILSTVAPVFILIALGYGAVRSGYLRNEIADYLNAFAIKLAVPALLFTAMVRIDFGQVFSWRVLISFYSGALICFAVGIILARLVFKRRPGESVAVGFAAMFSNSVLLGLPILERAHGQDVMMIGFGIIAFHAPVIYTAGMITMEMMRRDGRPLGVTLQSAGRSLVANPLMAGILAGVTVNLLNIPLPGVIAAPFQMLAAAAIPAALIGMGAALTRYKINEDLPETAMVAALSLVLHPAIAFGLAWGVFDLPKDMVLAIVTIAAMPPGINIYIFATIYDRAVGLAASALLVSTVLSVLSISAWLYALAALL